VREHQSIPRVGSELCTVERPFAVGFSSRTRSRLVGMGGELGTCDPMNPLFPMNAMIIGVSFELGGSCSGG